MRFRTRIAIAAAVALYTGALAGMVYELLDRAADRRDDPYLECVAWAAAAAVAATGLGAIGSLFAPREGA